MAHADPLGRRRRHRTPRRTLLTALVIGLSPAAGSFAHPLPALASGDAAGTTYVANIFGNSINVFAPGATGNATPIRTISGAATGLNSPVGVALDPSGTLYVANYSAVADSVTEYGPGVSGNASPVRTIAGAATGLNQPVALVFDGSGTLYVANYSGNSVTEFAAGATSAFTLRPPAVLSGRNPRRARHIGRVAHLAPGTLDC